MKPIIDISQSALDSPDYRVQIMRTEQSIWNLESTVKSLHKSTKNGVEAAAEYSAKNSLFANELEQLAAEESDEPVVLTTLQKFAGCIKEIERSRQIMLSQLRDVFTEPLDNLVKKDIAGVKESRKVFERSSDSADSALDRYLSKRIKDPGLQESADEVGMSRRDFHEKSIYYSLELNDFQYRKRPDLIENVLAYMYTQFSFFHQAYDVMKDIEPSMRELTAKLAEIRQTHESNTASVKEHRVQLIKEALPIYNPTQGFSRSSVKPPSGTASTTASTAPVKAGYLIKKGSGQIRAVWSRRWFTLRGDYLLYSTRGKDEPPTVAVNLRLGMVKPTENAERRFCFDVISPHKSYTLQAENEKEMQEWIEFLQAAISRALNNDHSTDHLMKGVNTKEKLDEDFFEADAMVTSSRQEANAATLQTIEAIKQLPGNNACVDCRAEDPEWASFNLGALLCIECSGIHRSLGVQVSKVRSLTLDKWEPEAFEIMLALGNQKVNDIFERNYGASNQQNIAVNSDSSKRPSAKSERAEKERWITAKYVAKHFVCSPDQMENYGSAAIKRQFWQSCQQRDLVTALQALAMGATVDYDENPSVPGKQTPLLHAIQSNDALMIQFLLSWNADLKVTDADGYGALHYAVKAANMKLTESLLKRNIKFDLKAKDGKTPTDIALEMANPDLVTMLRMHRFELEQHQNNGRLLQQQQQRRTSATASGEDQPTTQPQATLAADGQLPLPTEKKLPAEPSNMASSTPIAATTGGVSSSLSSSSSTAVPSKIALAQAQASAMAGSAAAYANRILKTGFAKLHQESSPAKSIADDDKDKDVDLANEGRPEDSGNKAGISGTGKPVAREKNQTSPTSKATEKLSNMFNSIRIGKDYGKADEFMAAPDSALDDEDNTT